MVAVLVGLKLTLLRRSLSTSMVRRVGVILGACFALLMVGLAIATLVGLRSTDVETARAVTVLLFSSVTVSWLLLPLLIFGVDETLDPARFSLLPLTATRLRPGLLAAGLIGIPGLGTALAALASVITWTRGPAAAVAALIGAGLGVLTCFLASRVVTSGFSTLLSSRRFKDLAAVVLGVLALGLGVGSSLISNSAGSDPDRVKELATNAGVVAGWTPFGWAWALPADVADGAWLTAVVRLVLAAGLVLGLWVAWGRLLNRALTNVTESEASRVGAHAGWMDRFYGTSPAGAIAARCIRYWRRDPRYIASMVSLAVMPLILGVSFGLGEDGSRGGMLVMPLILAGLAGPGLSSDLAYDGSAFWTHVTSGIPGSADRWGRLMALATFIVPLILVVLVVSLVLSGRADFAVGTVAMTIALGCCGAGLGLAVGGAYPGTAPPQGGNPFSTGSGNGLLTILLFLGGAVGAAVLSSPVIALAVLGLDSLVLQLAALAVAVVLGPLVLIAGVRWGGRQLEAAWPERLSQVAALERA